ncbi:MAG: glycosyltransferase [Anaerolineales bacterium]|nr:glycosyltransferase [Anaerolineales bacterium]
MRVLFLTPQLPYPPRQGTALRNWGLIQHLSQRQAVSLLSFAEAGQPLDSELLRKTCLPLVTVPAPQRPRAARLQALFSPQPDLAQRLWSAEFAAALQSLLHSHTFDVIHIEGLELARYIPIVRAHSNAKLVFDAHNAEYVIQRRAFETDWRNPRRWPAALYSWLQWPRLKRFEAETLSAVHAVTCCSPEDAAALQALVPTIKPVIVPNGIDINRYQPVATGPQLSAIFTGKMDYRPNVDAVLWFAAEIWPRVRAQVLNAQFTIVGQKPLPTVQQLHGQNGITVTGAVPAIQPYLAEASVYVAPLRMGGGTRLKLLEAMAMRKPIVSTTVGAEGFAVRSGQELLLADAPDTFAQAVVELLRNPALGEKLSAAGYVFVRTHYDWPVIIPTLETLHAELIRNS